MEIDVIENWKKEATSDKGFFSIFINSVSVVGRPIDLFVFVILFISSAAGSIFVSLVYDKIILISRVVDISRQIATYGGNVSVCILGFLITGFSIFATMIKPKLFHALAKFRIKGRRISEFKFVFYNFLYIFANYIIYLLICSCCIIFMAKGSPVWYAGIIFYRTNRVFVDAFGSLFLSFLVAYTVYIVLLLRGFVWNLYQSILFAIFAAEPDANNGGG